MKMKRMLYVFVLPMLLFAGQLFAQERTVTGRVTDTSGAPVANASVVVSGGSSGTQTSADGVFSIKVPANVKTLVVTSIGFTIQNVPIGEGPVNVTLRTANAALSEVVVVGYGTQRRSEVTASIVKISDKDLNQGAISNPLQQIAGKAAGVQITQVGSEPGVAPNIRIRGITSLSGGNDPLVVIDGVQGGTDLLNQLSPNEIESFEILKDASATAIYGSRGAAGVVLVTTKRARAGQTFVEYNANYAYQTIAKKFDLLNADEWRAAATARGLNLTNIDFGGNTNWFNEISRSGYTQNHNLAFGGGTNNLSYRASVTAILQKGVILNSDNKNYIGRMQVTQKALDNRLTFTGNLNISVLRNNYNGPGVVAVSLFRRPTDPIYAANPDPFDRNGPYFKDPNSFNYTNPYARAKEIIDGNDQNNFFGSLRTDLAVVKGVTLSWFGSWRRLNNNYGGYQAPRTSIPDAVSSNGIAFRNTNNTDEKLTNIILNYRRQISQHSINADFIYEWQKNVYEGIGATGRGFLNDVTTYNDLESSDVTRARSGDVSSFKNDRTLASFLARFNYSYLGKYAFTASMRRDGASVFGINNRWANFPAVSASWRISKEGFMANQQIFSDLALRAGFGITGNQGGLGPLNSIERAGVSGSAFFNGALIPVLAINQNANPDLKWETKRQANFGIDFTMLDKRLSGTVDYFIGNTKDLLFTYNVPQPPFPAPTIYANIGQLQNRGVEVSLNYQLVRSNDLSVTLAGNFTKLTNKIVELSGTYSGIQLNTDTVRWGTGGTSGVSSSDNGISYLIKGRSIGTFLLYHHVGVDAFGNQILDDRNKNGLTPLTSPTGDIGDRSPDRVNAGQALPKFTIGFTPSASYKNLDLSLVVRGAYGHKIYNAISGLLSSMSSLGTGNVLKSALTTNMNNVAVTSDYFLENGAWTRLENLTVGYRFNTSKWGYINNLRVSFTANNLFVITDYTGIDPELNTSGGSGYGIDYAIYPRTRNFSLGVSVNLK